MTTRYEIVVERFPEKYIPVLRELRQWGGFGLKEAKEICEYVQTNCPCVLLAGVTQEAAEDLRRLLVNAGVKALVRASSLENPMFIYPRLDDCYEAHWLFGLRRRPSAE